MVDPTEASSQPEDRAGGQGGDFAVIQLGSVVAKGTGYRRYLLTAVSLVCFVGLSTGKLTHDQADAVKTGATHVADGVGLLVDGGIVLFGIAAHFLPGLYRLGLKH